MCREDIPGAVFIDIFPRGGFAGIMNERAASAIRYARLPAAKFSRSRSCFSYRAAHRCALLVIRSCFLHSAWARCWQICFASSSSRSKKISVSMHAAVEINQDRRKYDKISASRQYWVARSGERREIFKLNAQMDGAGILSLCFIEKFAAAGGNLFDSPKRRRLWRFFCAP
jgi:hypothetical protein